MAASTTARKNKTKEKQQLLQTSLPERVKGECFGELAKIPPAAADCFF